MDILQQLLTDLNELSTSVRSVGEDDWTFVNAVYFSLTVVTTIGTFRSQSAPPCWETADH